jgi:uncharacterized lipoprotein YddW (UPF0748 family)
MKKKIFILMFILMINLGFISTIAYEPVSSAVQTATTYLQVRPNSSRTNLQLTLSQLNGFKTTVRSTINTANTKMYDIDINQIETRMQAIEAELSGVTESQFSANFTYYYQLYEELFSIYSMTIDSKVIEGRGMWHRPFERNLTEVQTTLQEMVDMGVNMLYVETFWLGRLIYPSNVAGTYQHGFTLQQGYGDYGNNLLLAFVEEGKKMGVEVHAWVENFFVGFGSNPSDSPILANKPEWILYNYDFTVSQKNEGGPYLFMDPANPEVRQYLKDIYVEIIQTTDVASIHLDYIRYPVARRVTNLPATNHDTGFSLVAEADFKLQYGYQGDLRALLVNNLTVANHWRQYKTQVISDFVAGVYFEVKNVDPNMTLSIAIFGNVNNAIVEKMQDWKSWIDDGYIEIIMPMAYYQSSLTVANEVGNLVNLVGNNAFSYAGIAPSYMGFNEHLNTTQIQASLSRGAQGTAFFASQFYMFSRNDYPSNQKSYALEIQQVLKDGVFRNDAILPHSAPELLIDTQFNHILDKANRIYLPRGAMSQFTYNLLSGKFDQIKAMPTAQISDLSAIVDELKAIPVADYTSNTHAKDRIAYDINYLVKLLEIRIQRTTIDVNFDFNINPDPGFTEPPTQFMAPTNLRIEGNFLKWDGVSHATRYQVIATQDGVQVIYPSIIGTQYSIANLNPGLFTFKVKALGDGFIFTDSEISETITYDISPILLTVPSNLRVEDDIVKFDPVDHAIAYEVKINFSEFTITSTSFDLKPFNLAPGVYNITVKALGNNLAIFDSDVSETYAYIIERELTEVQKEVESIVKQEIRELILFLLKND